MLLKVVHGPKSKIVILKLAIILDYIYFHKTKYKIMTTFLKMMKAFYILAHQGFPPKKVF